MEHDPSSAGKAPGIGLSMRAAMGRCVVFRQWMGPIVLCIGVVGLFAISLRSINAFAYRPSEDVSDLTVTFWPNVHYIRQTWANYRQVPLWRTSIFSGSPFDADPQSGLWYPLNVVFLLLPATVGFNVLFVMHVIAGGLGVWTWSRATGTSMTGALLAALAYAFTPKVFAHLGFGHVGLVYAAAYIPWTLWAACRVGQGSWLHLGALGLTLGWQLIAHAQLTFYTGLVAGVYGLSTACFGGSIEGPLRAKSRQIGSSVGRMALAMGLAALVAAVQLVPMAQFAPLSGRAGMGFSESAISSVPPRYLMGLLLADHRGFMDTMLYVGIPVLVLALVALVHRRAWPWWIGICVSLVYLLGTNTPFYGWVFRVLPVLAWLRAPSRVWFVMAAVLALLAGWGLDELRRISDQSRRSIQRVLNLGLAAFGMLALGLLLGYTVGLGRPPANLIALGVVTPATAGLVMIYVGRSGPGGISRPAIAGALVAVAVADLWIVDMTLVEGRPPERVFGEDEIGVHLAAVQAGEPFRVYSPSYSLPRHIAASYGLETADGVDPLYLERYAAYMELATGVQRQGYGETIPALQGEGPLELLNRDALLKPAMLGLLSVRYIAAEFPMEQEELSLVGQFGSTYLYENASWLPRAFVAGHVVPVEDFRSAMAWLAARGVEALSHTAIVHGDGADPPPLASRNLQWDLVWLEQSPNRQMLEVSLDHTGFLLLSQVWYPGWRVVVDGRRAKLWQADAVLSGVYLQPGRHIVSFAYRPYPTMVAAAISGITWLALGVLCCAGLWQRRAWSRFPEMGDG